LRGARSIGFNSPVSSLDQFASVFNAADLPVFQYDPPALKRVLVVTDLAKDAAQTFTDNAKKFLSATEGPWEAVDASGFSTVKDLLNLVEDRKPDFIVTYRHLHSDAWHWPYSLGEHLDVLIQVTTPPVVILPHPNSDGVPEHALKNTDSVMAITDHLAGSDTLVNVAARITSPGGTLHLTHIENAADFERYMEAISKIPEIDTDTARETMLAQLLRDPSEFIDSCEAVLAKNGVELKVVKHIEHGHRLAEYRRAVDENKVDLIVLEGHAEDQLAMNATAYSLAVELQTVPVMIV